MRPMDIVLSRTTQAGGTITVTAQIPTVCLVKAWRIVIGTHKLFPWNQRSLWSEDMCSKIGRPYSRLMNLLKFKFPSVKRKLTDFLWKYWFLKEQGSLGIMTGRNIDPKSALNIELI